MFNKKGYYVAMTKLGARKGDPAYYRHPDRVKDRAFLLSYCQWAYEKGYPMAVDNIEREHFEEFFTEQVKTVREGKNPQDVKALESYAESAFSMFGISIDLAMMGLYAPYDDVICPTCHVKAQYISSALIFGKDYGMRYQCPVCGKRVGVHKGTAIPYGLLADHGLQAERAHLHYYFDSLWKAEPGQGRGLMTRNEAYEWLSGEMGLSVEETHIGCFTADQCTEALAKIAELKLALTEAEKESGVFPQKGAKYGDLVCG